MRDFMKATNSKMIDDTENCMLISDRIKFVNKFGQFMLTQSAETQ